MSEQTASTGKLIVLLMIGLALSAGAGSLVIFTSKPNAHSCQVTEGMFGKFQTPNIKTLAPRTTFLDGAGNEKRLSDFNGRGIVVNFWATWCAPCVHEMPQLDRLKFLLNDSDIEVLAVSEDRKGTAYVKKFLAKNKLHNLETLIDKNGMLIRALKGRGLPTTVLFNRKGMEVGRVIGAAEWDSPEVLSYIRECLGS